jgi:rRNA maturation RNase YbeY
VKVNFHYDIENFRIRESRQVKNIINRIISDAGKKGVKVDVIITGDEKLYEINKEFLGHDYYTDIITFDYNEGRAISGEIYISAERVKDNSRNFGVSFNVEMRRVIFHGFLHLCGYDDRTKEERKKMSEMEEMYLALSYAE